MQVPDLAGPIQQSATALVSSGVLGALVVLLFAWNIWLQYRSQKDNETHRADLKEAARVAIELHEQIHKTVEKLGNYVEFVDDERKRDRDLDPRRNER